jgi:circadian clock protein KaiB
MSTKGNKRGDGHKRGGRLGAGRGEEPVVFSSLEDFERELSEQGLSGQFVLRLFVSGSTPKSSRAVENVKRICEAFLPGRYELEVVDVYQQPELARDKQLIAAPTLIREEPPPVRRIVGDMSNEEKVLIGLDLRCAT